VKRPDQRLDMGVEPVEVTHQGSGFVGGDITESGSQEGGALGDGHDIVKLGSAKRSGFFDFDSHG
jgi:hypothetical protein